VDVGGIVVLLVAGDFATVTADALRHVEVEAVLLAGLRQARHGKEMRMFEKRELQAA
jgi:hypothetical protein